MRNELAERVDATCAFASAYLEFLDDSDASAKAACEIALFAGVLLGEAELASRFGPWALSVLPTLSAYLRAAPIVSRILWMPSRASMYGVGHGLLARAGMPHDALESVIGLITRQPIGQTRELLPYESLETRWVRQLLDDDVVEPPQEGLATARPFHPLFMSEGDAYSYTHTVFYLTDFGRRPLSASLADEVANIAEAGVAWSLARADFDLLCEFALCCLFANAGPSCVTRLGLQSLLSAWDDLGCVPDRSLAGLQPPLDRRRLLQAGYHANLVAGLFLANLWLRPEWLERPESSAPLEGRLLRTWRVPGAVDVAEGLPEVPELSPAKLLAEILGERAAPAVLLRMSPSILTKGCTDVAIHRAVHVRSLERTAAGVARALQEPAPTSSALLGAEWLMLFAGAMHSLGLSQGTPPGIGTLVARAREFRSLHFRGL